MSVANKELMFRTLQVIQQAKTALGGLGEHSATGNLPAPWSNSILSLTQFAMTLLQRVSTPSTYHSNREDFKLALSI